MRWRNVFIFVIAILMVVLLIILLSSCQPTVIEVPVTTTQNNVSIEQITDSPDVYRLYDRQEGVLCYVAFPNNSAGNGIDCMPLEE